MRRSYTCLHYLPGVVEEVFTGGFRLGRQSAMSMGGMVSALEAQLYEEALADAYPTRKPLPMVRVCSSCWTFGSDPDIYRAYGGRCLSCILRIR